MGREAVPSMEVNSMNPALPLSFTVHPQSPRDILVVESGFKIQTLRVRSGKTPADRRGMKYSRGYGGRGGGAWCVRVRNSRRRRRDLVGIRVS